MSFSGLLSKHCGILLSIGFGTGHRNIAVESVKVAYPGLAYFLTHAHIDHMPVQAKHTLSSDANTRVYELA